MLGTSSTTSSRLTLHHSRTSIEFTDGLALFAIAMALFWSIDPLMIQLWRYSLTRHVPTIFAVGAMVLCVVGRLLFRPGARAELGVVLRTYSALLFFATFVIAGSLYAKFARGIDNTFVFMGISLILGGPVNLWIIRTSNAPMALVRSITIAIVSISLLAVMANAIHFGTLVFHAMEHVVLVAVALPLIASRKILVRLASAALVILGVIAPNKITGYIVMLVIFGWVYIDELMIWTARDADKIRAGLRRVLGALLALVAMVAVIAVYEATKSHLPDGNTTYRMHTYQIAFDRFLDSWVWGRWFAAASVDHFDLFVVNTSTQFLPTHSDPLDILANGGLLAAIPFSLGLLSILYSAWKALNVAWSVGDKKNEATKSLLVMYFLILVSGLTVIAFNPVLNAASLSYVYWTCSAVVCVLAETRNDEKSRSNALRVRG